MSSSVHSAGQLHILTDARKPLDWLSPFWTLTLAFVFVGVVAALRLMFTVPQLWAEALALPVVILWRYWAHASGLWPWVLGASHYQFPSFAQAALNAFPWFIFWLIASALAWGKPTIGSLLSSLVAGVVFGLFDIEPVNSAAAQGGDFDSRRTPYRRSSYRDRLTLRIFVVSF